MIDDPEGGDDAQLPEDGHEQPARAGDDAVEDVLDPADRELLAELRAVAARLDPVPDETLLAARSSLAYLRLDAALAELTFDSLTDAAPVAVRSQTAAARQLSFEAGAFHVEVEVVQEAKQRRLVGQCVPATEVEVTLHRQGEAATHPTTRITTDDLGRFVIDVAPGMVSLRCRWPAADVTVATAWVTV
jgi:hypothetical protein